MLALLRQAKVRKYRLENLLLLDTLVFLCISSGRVKDIMRLIRFGASPSGSFQGLSPKIMHRIEDALLDSVPGALTAQAATHGPCLELVPGLAGPLRQPACHPRRRGISGGRGAHGLQPGRHGDGQGRPGALADSGP